MKKILIVFLISLSFSHSYNYYRFELQRWCSTEFKIHGLWPEFNSQDWPSFCSGPSYNQTELSSLLPEMEEDWRPCSSDNLWEHEWTKHGTCTFEQVGWSIFDYFNVTLHLYENIRHNLSLICSKGSDCLAGCYDLDLKPIECF